MTLKEAKDSAVRAYLFRVLSEAQGNITKAAKIAGVHRVSMYALLERYGLKVEHRAYLKTTAS